jgi:CDP-paratose synthetase
VAKILLTGATGFLGSRIAHYLFNDFKVIVIKRKSSNTYRLKKISENLTFFNIEEISLADIFKNFKIDVIIHCATNYGGQDVDSGNIYESNVYFPSQLLKLGIAQKSKLFINVDTFYNANYGYLEQYSASKDAFRKILYDSQDKIKIINTKIGIVYGSGDNLNKFTVQTIIKLLNNEPIINFTLGEQKRHFVYVDDAAFAYKLILENLNAFKNGYTDIYIGNGVSTSIKSYVNIIFQITGSTSTLNFGSIPYRTNEIMNPIGNFELLKNLEWREHFTLTSGLIKTINYFKLLRK